MEKGLKKIRVIKEKEKIQQVTHWDLDYLSKDEVRDLYELNPAQYQRKDEIRHSTAKSKQKLSLLMITMGLFLLAGSLYVASLIWIRTTGELIFSGPLFILAFTFIAAPESKVCRLKSMSVNLVWHAVDRCCWGDFCFPIDQGIARYRSLHNPYEMQSEKGIMGTQQQSEPTTYIHHLKKTLYITTR